VVSFNSQIARQTRHPRLDSPKRGWFSTNGSSPRQDGQAQKTRTNQFKRGGTVNDAPQRGQESVSADTNRAH
jgi:hypothetical protein